LADFDRISLQLGCYERSDTWGWAVGDCRDMAGERYFAKMSKVGHTFDVISFQF